MRKLATAAVAAGIVGAGLLAAPGTAQAAGIPDLRIEVGYGCRTTGSGPADWRTTAHVFTTIRNVGSAAARDVTAHVRVLPNFGVDHRIAVLEPGAWRTFDNDTFATSLTLNPAGGIVYSNGPDANPLDNVYVGLAPFTCSAL